MSPFQIVCAALVTIGASARLTRLIVFDTYPPVAWLRIKWHTITKDNEWSKLVDCGYCAAPYFTAALLAWGYFTKWQLAWWIVCCWLAASYAASIVVAYDGDGD
jgi:hypothetical protein